MFSVPRFTLGNVIADLKMRIDGSIRAQDMADKTERLCVNTSLSLTLETEGKERNGSWHLHNNELEEVPMNLYAIKYENVSSIVNPISDKGVCTDFHSNATLRLICFILFVWFLQALSIYICHVAWCVKTAARNSNAPQRRTYR